MDSKVVVVETRQGENQSSRVKGIKTEDRNDQVFFTEKTLT